MKIMVLLFFTIVLGSCGQSKEKKAVCEAYDNIGNCANEADIQTMSTCSADAVKGAVSKLDGEKLKISATQQSEMITASLRYETCISSALTEIRGASTLSLTADVDTSSSAEALEKFKKALKECLNELSSKSKSILKCE